MKSSVHSGVVLIVVLGVLILLAVFGITFVLLSGIEHQTSQTYLDKVRAKMLAQTGIEVAIVQLKSDASQQSARRWVYYGEDANQNNQLDEGEDQNRNGQLDTLECPVSQALRPSLAVLDKDNKPALYQTGLKKRGRSGELPPTYASHDAFTLSGANVLSTSKDSSDAYALKVTDCNSLIYLNGDGKGTERLLNNLGTVLELGNDLGKRIAEARLARPNKRFLAKDELKDVLGEQIYKKIAPYVTVYGYVNPRVIRPKPLEERPGWNVSGGRSPLQVGRDVYTWNSINPGKIELEPRAPLNINLAPKPVLMAALGNLEGFYLSEKDVPTDALKLPQDSVHPEGNQAKRLGTIQKTAIELDKKGASIGGDPATYGGKSMVEAIVDRIIEERNKAPFLAWAEFDDLLNKMVTDGLLGNASDEASRVRADIIRAQANPNTLLNDFNPNELGWRAVDKSDLSGYTTEFCFQPMGVFEIESCGFISVPSSGKPVTASGDSGLGELAPRRLLAEHRTRCVANLWENYTETSQKDFSKGMISTVSSADAYDVATHKGKTLQLYPEPDINNYPAQCESDGQVYLATLQNDAVSGKGNDLLTFKAHFDNGIGASACMGKPDVVTEYDTSDKEGRPGGKDLARPNTNSLFADTKSAGSVYPDGAYCEWGATPSYEAAGNFMDGNAHRTRFGDARFRGTLTFWAKLNYQPQSTKPRIFFTATRCHSGSNYFQSNQSVFELFAFPKSYLPLQSEYAAFLKTDPRGRLLWFWEMDEARGNWPDEYVISNNPGSLSEKRPSGLNSHHQWMHIAMLWDSSPKTKYTGTYSSRGCPSCGGTGTLPVTCPHCGGIGSHPPQTCPTCRGNKKVFDGYDEQERTCGGCGGSGTTTRTVTRTGPCGNCGGSGRVTTRVDKRVGCGACRGSGRTPCGSCGGSGSVGGPPASCGRCGGRGKVKDRYGVDWPCGGCGGSGQISTKQPCSNCGGRGNLGTCPNCGGRGSIVDGQQDATGRCPNCGGRGSVSTGTDTVTGSCGSCGGSGKVIHRTSRYKDCTQCGGSGSIGEKKVCDNCSGSGRTGERQCPTCGGSGKLTNADTSPTTVRDVYAICLNGMDLNSANAYSVGGQAPPYYPRPPDFANPYNLIRLGERYASAVWNYAADATIDEFTIQLHPSVDAGRQFVLEEYNNGRYYKGEAVFTSAPITVPITVSGTTSARAVVNWTAYYPIYWDIDTRKIELQLVDEKNNPISGVLSDPSGSEATIPLNPDKGYATKIKYKVFFRGDAKDLNRPLLESPIFDDITIKFVYPEPRILKWSAE